MKPQASIAVAKETNHVMEPTNKLNKRKVGEREFPGFFYGS